MRAVCKQISPSGLFGFLCIKATSLATHSHLIALVAMPTLEGAKLDSAYPPTVETASWAIDQPYGSTCLKLAVNLGPVRISATESASGIGIRTK